MPLDKTLEDNPVDRRWLLAALNNTRKHIYEGTVAAATIARRRAANKAARKARRASR